MILDMVLPLPGDAAALVERVDEDCCNPLKCWHLLGEPADLTPEQTEFLRAAGKPRAEAIAPENVAGGQRVRLRLGKNAVLRMKLLPRMNGSDFGYDYSYYCEEEGKKNG